MRKFNIGDTVSVIDDTISGTLIRLQPNKCVIEDTDGFERIYSLSNIVVTKHIGDYLLDHPDTLELIRQKIESVTVQRIQNAQTVSKTSNKAAIQFNFEIDLHIEDLLDDHIGLSNFEIMQIQMQTCRMFIEKAIRLNSKKAVLIHGKGEGVLKHEIYNYLDRLENTKHIKIEYNDASYSNYGKDGATEVRFI
jgi:DNA-nicking Smr family endonuclease